MYNVTHVTVERRDMAQVPTTTVRIDPEVKERASKIFDELGLSLSAAVNIFLRAAVRRKGMPFDVVIPNNEEDEE